jgi:hypothetical protein
VLLGLALLAAHASILAMRWRVALFAGAAIDFALGLALHFGVQNLAFDRWFAPPRSLDAIFATYSKDAFMNIAAKVQHGLAFFSDALAVPPAATAAGLAALLALGLWRCRSRPADDR